MSVTLETDIHTRWTTGRDLTSKMVAGETLKYSLPWFFFLCSYLTSPHPKLFPLQNPFLKGISTPSGFLKNKNRVRCCCLMELLPHSRWLAALSRSRRLCHSTVFFPWLTWHAFEHSSSLLIVLNAPINSFAENTNNPHCLPLWHSYN